MSSLLPGREIERYIVQGLLGEGGMAALLGAELDQAQEIADAAAEGEVCAPANDNAPGQVVLSGAMGAIDRAIEIARGRGIRRSVKLPVSAPFHCVMMSPAADVMEKALGEVDIVRPLVPVMANVTAAPAENPDDIRSLLVEQVTSIVRWRECVLAMRDAGPRMRAGCVGAVLPGAPAAPADAVRGTTPAASAVRPARTATPGRCRRAASVMRAASVSKTPVACFFSFHSH